MVKLLGCKVNKLEVENRVKPGTRLSLQNQIKYNVSYMDAQNRCVGVAQLRITDRDMAPFELRMEMAGEFSYDEGDEKADIHTESFDQLFAYVRAAVSSAAGLTGLPGLMIPILRLNTDTVTVAGAEEKENSPLN